MPSMVLIAFLLSSPTFASPIDSVFILKVSFGEDDSRYCTGVQLAPRGEGYAHHWALVPQGCSMKDGEGSAFSVSDWCSDKVSLHQGNGKWENACAGGADDIQELGAGSSGFVLLPINNQGRRGSVTLGAFSPDFTKPLTEGSLAHNGFYHYVAACRFSRDAKTCNDRRASWSPIFDPAAGGSLIAFVGKNGQTLPVKKYAESLKDRVLTSDSKGGLVQPFDREDLKEVGDLYVYLDSRLNQDDIPENTLFIGIRGQDMKAGQFEVYHKGQRQILKEATIRGFNGTAFQVETRGLRAGSKVSVHWFNREEGAFNFGHVNLLVEETSDHKDRVVSAGGE